VVFKLLALAGVHGQEPQSSYLLSEISKDFTLVDKEPFQVYFFSDSNIEIYSIPRFNEYGLLKNTRGNKNKVDLNRNLPAANWSKDYDHEDYFPGKEACSEIENLKLVSIIQSFQPDLILSIHTNHFVTKEHPPQVNFDGLESGPGIAYAKNLAEIIDLQFTTDIGYSTPGSLGSYAKDHDIPCITLELDHNLDDKACFERYFSALNKFIGELKN
jgi:protein MpaA